MGFIYKIENKVNGKKYIGKTRRTDVTVRWNEHINSLNAGKHVNRHLQNAWRKYGFANFDFSIVSEYPVDYDEKLLADAEIKYIDFFDSYRNGYNLTVATIGDEEPVLWKYTVSKSGKTCAGTPKFTIYDRNHKRLISSVNENFLRGFLPLLNSDEEAGLKAIEESKQFKYRVSKGQVNTNGKRSYNIYGKDHLPLISSVNKSKLNKFVEILNENEEEGLKAIEESKKFRYKVGKGGTSSSGTRQFCITDKSHKNLISSKSKSYLDFVVELLNSNEDEWIIEENGKFKLKNKKLLKELYKKL